MKAFALLALLAVALQPLAAQSQSVKQSATATLAQTERSAVELRQGMSLEEVSRLLGKPRRTALRDVGGSSVVPSQGTLQWLYSWDGSDRGTLRIEFTPKAEGAWGVASWEWATF